MRLVDTDTLLESGEIYPKEEELNLIKQSFVVTDRKKYTSNFDFDDNRPQCCIDHDKYFSTCDICEFGGN